MKVVTIITGFKKLHNCGCWKDFKFGGWAKQTEANTGG